MATLASRLVKHHNRRTNKVRYSLNYRDVPVGLTAHMQDFKVIGKNLFVAKKTVTTTEVRAKMTLEDARKQFGKDFRIGDILGDLKGTSWVKATPEQTEKYRVARIKLDNWILATTEEKLARDLVHFDKRIGKARNELTRVTMFREATEKQLAEVVSQMNSVATTKI